MSDSRTPDIMGDLMAGPEVKKKSSGKDPNPIGVKLDADDIAELDRISDELGIVRHHLMQYAVKDFIARYNRGEKPKTKKETVVRLDMD